jgi:hypothetical protein
MGAPRSEGPRIRLARELQLARHKASTVPRTDMNTPNWMMDAPAAEPRRAKKVRYRRRAADRTQATDVFLAFVVMLGTMGAIYVLTSVLLR